jgi:putative phosphoribosyl transferase
MLLDRTEAGSALANSLSRYHGFSDAVVLGFPRGGMIVAGEISRKLELPLDVFLSRKLLMPHDTDIPFGVVTETGSIYLSPYIPGAEFPHFGDVQEEIERRKKELYSLKLLYRGGRSLPSLTGRTVILADDGAVTGATILAAAEAVRHIGPSRLIAALGVATPTILTNLRRIIDDAAVLDSPVQFRSLRYCYHDFGEVSDAAILELLTRRRGGPRTRRHMLCPPTAA